MPTKKKLSEARALEQEIGWPEGTLSNPDGWPDPPPRTKKQKEAEAKRQKEAFDKFMADTNRIAEEKANEFRLRIGRALAPIVETNGTWQTDEAELTELGRTIENLLEEAELSIGDIHEPYDW